jgi:hypothetical protein
MVSSETFLNRVKQFCSESIIPITFALMIGIISWFVPFASGDDYAYRLMYRGSSTFFEDIINLYRGSNGRAVMNYFCIAIAFYKDTYFIWAALGVAVIMKTAKELFGLKERLPQLFFVAGVFWMSHDMLRHSFLWRSGHEAYISWFSIVLTVLYFTHKYVERQVSSSKSIAAILVVLVFLCGFCNENLSIGLVGYHVGYYLMHRKKNSKINGFLLATTITSFSSMILCIFAPSNVGGRFFTELNNRSDNVIEMVTSNIVIIIGWIFHNHGMLFAILCILHIVLLLQGGFKVGKKISVALIIAFLLYAAVLFLPHIPLPTVLESYQQAATNWFFFNGILTVIIWMIYAVLLLTAFFLSKNPEIVKRFLPIILLGCVSIGSLIVIPWLREQTIFYFIFSILFYGANLTCYIKWPQGVGKRIVAATLIILSFMGWEQLLFIADKAHAVATQRDTVAQHYQELYATGQADEIRYILFDSFEAGSVGWSDNQMNPMPYDTYPYGTIKDYYHIPDSVKVFFFGNLKPKEIICESKDETECSFAVETNEGTLEIFGEDSFDLTATFFENWQPFDSMEIKNELNFIYDFQKPGFYTVFIEWHNKETGESGYFPHYAVELE